MALLLASGSPRRAELLDAAGFRFRVEIADVDESLRPGEDPEAHVARLAARKAEVVACRNSGTWVIGADTEVVLAGRIFGKPRDLKDAADMLKSLSGNVHEVLTGVAVLGPQSRRDAICRTRVRFLPLTDREVAWYAATGEPADKAGAYAIQGRASRFIDWIDGSYSNVVGLPVATVCRLLRETGYPI